MAYQPHPPTLALAPWPLPRPHTQLAEQRARDEAEEAEKTGKVELRATLKPKIDAWAAGKKVRCRLVGAASRAAEHDMAGRVAVQGCRVVCVPGAGTCMAGSDLSARERYPCLLAALTPAAPFRCSRRVQDNIRALLASLHTVLWEGSGWTPPNMADMVENAKVGAEEGAGGGGQPVCLPCCRHWTPPAVVAARWQRWSCARAPLPTAR